MKTFPLLSALFVAVILPASVAATNTPSACKPVKQYGVSGCELLPDHTCPAGYHKQAVGPPNPQMKAPARLMCVPDKPSDKPSPKKHKSKATRKPIL